MTYQAQAFNDQFSGGRASGDLTVTRSSVVFCNPQTEKALPLNGLRVYAGGANQRLIFFEHPSVPDWSFYTSDRAVLRDAGLQAVLAPLLAQLQRQRRQRQLTGLAAVLLLCLLPLAALWQMDTMTGWAAARVPVAWEEELGEKALAQYRFGHKTLSDSQAEKSLQVLAEALTDHIDAPRHTFRFEISDDPSLNAFALPGGYVVLNAGLIQAATTPEELLGVMAHELSHVTEQHGVRNIISSLGIIVFFQAVIGDAGGLAASIGSAVPMLLTQGYSRDFEREADERGFALLLRANIDPVGMVKFFERIQAEENEKLAEVVDDAEQREWLASAQAWLGTHPATEERIATLKERVAREAPGAGYRRLDAEFFALKQSVEQFVANKTTTTDAESKESQNEN